MAEVTRPGEPSKRYQAAENLTQGNAGAAGGRNLGAKAACPGTFSVVSVPSLQNAHKAGLRGSRPPASEDRGWGRMRGNTRGQPKRAGFEKSLNTRNPEAGP